MLDLLSKTKDASIKKDILHFLGFLFESDFDDINGIISSAYQILGPAEHFLEWAHKLLPRSSSFVTEFLEKTEDFSQFA